MGTLMPVHRLPPDCRRLFTQSGPFYGFKEGVDPGDVDFAPLGYAEEAIESFSIFSRLQKEGAISPETRFQVALPTPTALLTGFVVLEDRAALEPGVEAAIVADLKQIQEEIPADQLTVQWDVCFEVVGVEGGPPLHFRDPIAGSVDRLDRLCREINDGVEAGIHLCYGDPGHKHIVEPSDLAVSVAFANGISQASSGRLGYVHMPVPGDRGDRAYFEPLRDLKLEPGTRLILGLVHYSDGVEGGRARMAVADEFVRDYDIATECGFGRRDPDTIPRLLEIHRELCEI